VKRDVTVAGQSEVLMTDRKCSVVDIGAEAGKLSPQNLGLLMRRKAQGTLVANIHRCRTFHRVDSEHIC
jgi:hypothetical protein